MTRLPLDFPPLVEMATESAVEWHDSIRSVFASRGANYPMWHELSADSRMVGTAAMAALLSDLTRPESRAVWFRWLAKRLGWLESDHMGEWRHMPPRPSPRELDGSPVREDFPECWILERADWECQCFCAPDPEWIPEGWRAIPGLPMRPQDRFCALTLTILAVTGGAR